MRRAYYCLKLDGRLVPDTVRETKDEAWEACEAFRGWTRAQAIALCKEEGYALVRVRVTEWPYPTKDDWEGPR